MVEHVKHKYETHIVTIFLTENMGRLQVTEFIKWLTNYTTSPKHLFTLTCSHKLQPLFSAPSDIVRLQLG